MWGHPSGAPQAESCQEDSGPGHYQTRGGQAHQGICEYRDRSEARGPSALGMYEHPHRGPSQNAVMGEQVARDWPGRCTPGRVSVLSRVEPHCGWVRGSWRAGWFP